MNDGPLGTGAEISFMRRVVVTGLGLVAATGNNVKAAWVGAVEGKSGVTRISCFDPAALPVQIAAEVKDFSTGDALDYKEAKRITRFVQMGVVAAREALVDAGMALTTQDLATRDHWGCSIGVGIGGLDDIYQNSLILKEQGARRVSPFFMPYTIANMASGVVSRLYQLRGPNICTTTACTSGTHGIGEAYMYIKNGMADVMIAGGAESAICPIGIAAFSALKALSTNNANPGEASRPFDKERDGFVMGEGAGILVLEDYEHAKKRGAKIYAEIAGYGLSGDAYHITAPPPEGEGAQRCMNMALRTGKVNKEDIDYINAHGTSTGLNDKYESAAIQQVFGSHASQVAISSTKGVTGHCLGAAGGIEAVFTTLAIHHSVVPPTANLRTPDPECPLDYTALTAREKKIRYALSNSFGFGGTNGTLLFKSLEA
jgi:3-oxoacyl-[acyl-carrier-protein] synthase II